MSIDRIDGVAMRVFLGLKPAHVSLPDIELPETAQHIADLHMTLAFLGQVGTELVDRLVEELDALQPMPQCYWQSQYVGDFPSCHKAKVLACYSDVISPSLQDILLAVERIPMVANAIRRPFRPHVTLAPIKKATGLQWPFQQDWKFDALCLYQSTSDKPKYKALAQWSLR